MAMEPDPKSKVLKQLQPNPGFLEVEAVHKKRYPKEYTGNDSIDPRIVLAQRKQIAHLQQGEDDLPLSFHNPALLPLLEKLQTFAEKQHVLNGTNKALSKLLMEMDFQRKLEDINHLWLIGMHFRSSLALSTIGADESDVFSHVPNREIFFGLQKSNAWQYFLSSYIAYQEFDNGGHELSLQFDTFLPPQSEEKLINSVANLLPARVVYPCLEQGKLGIPFLVKQLLLDIFPVAFPAKALQGHGTSFSMFGFGTHDFLHYLSDRRRHHFLEYVIQEAEAHYLKGGSIPEFTKAFPPFARARYYNVMGSLQETYMNMVSKIIPTYGNKMFQKAMVGFFWIMHETMNFPASLYRTNDFESVLQTITAETDITGVSFAVENHDSWESDFDPLNTSPITGETGMTDNVIYSYVMGNFGIEEANCYKYATYFPEGPIVASDVVGRSIKKSKRFIDVSFHMKDGSELTYTFPTLLHKWMNADDNIGLLAYGGTSLKKPNLMEASDPRITAQDFLKTVEENIHMHVTYFKEMALSLANVEPAGEGSSLAQRFFRNQFALDKSIKKHLHISDQ